VTDRRGREWEGSNPSPPGLKASSVALSPPDLHVPSFQDLVARIVTGLKEDPVGVYTHAGLGQIPHVDAVEERARAIDGGPAVDDIASSRYASSLKHPAIFRTDFSVVMRDAFSEAIWMTKR
jgi:hypothetical protein